MWKRLRRWHFDVAILVGLASFAWAYWYIKPRPAWTSYYTPADPKDRYNFTILGYSADDQSIFTSYEKWPFPRIQRWSVKTGEMLEDIPLKPTEEEAFVAKQPRRHIGYSGYEFRLCDDGQHFLLRYDQATQKDHCYLRVFDVNGKAVGQGLEIPRFYRAEFIHSRSAKDRNWMWCFYLNPKLKEMPVTMVDLDRKTPVREPLLLSRQHLLGFPQIVEGKYLTYVLKATDEAPLVMVVVDLMTGADMGRIRIHAGDYHLLFCLDETHFAVCSMEGKFSSFQTTVWFYSYDTESKQFTEDLAHPLHGVVSEPNTAWYVKPPYLVSIKSEQEQSTSELVKLIMGWLSRLGIGRNAEGGSIKVVSLADRSPVRQCTGLPSGGFPHSHLFESIVMLSSGPDGVPGFSLYQIPHYSWEATLTWIMWLSLLLIVPWPLRYWVKA